MQELKLEFDVIGVSETKITNSNLPLDINLNIPGFSFEYVPTPLSSGGVGMYINNNLNYTVLEKTSSEDFQALWIEICFSNKKNIICGAIYRQHRCPKEFLTYFDQALQTYSSKRKTLFVLGDFNIDLLKIDKCNYSQNFLLSLQSCYLFPTIDKPTRIYNNSATLIDNIFMNQPEPNLLSGNIISDISDHYSQFCIIPCKKNKPAKQNGKKKVRLYSKFLETNFIKELSNADLGVSPPKCIQRR